MALTADQLAYRRNGIGASESPCLLGVSPFGNKVSVWCEKMGLEIRQPTIEQEIGNELEEGIGRIYVRKTGYEVAHFGTVVHPLYPWMMATPDLAVRGERRLAQIKLVGSWMAHHWDGGVPEYVEAQCQHEMEVCDADACDVVALIGGTDLRILPLERDKDLGADLVEVCHAFMRDHVEPREMPDVDGSAHADAMLWALYRQKRPDLLVATEEVEQWGREWLALDKSIERDSLEQKRFEQLLKIFIGEAAGIEGQAFRVTWKTSVNGKRPFLCKEARVKGRAA